MQTIDKLLDVMSQLLEAFKANKANLETESKKIESLLVRAKDPLAQKRKKQREYYARWKAKKQKELSTNRGVGSIHKYPHVVRPAELVELKEEILNKAVDTRAKNKQVAEMLKDWRLARVKDIHHIARAIQPWEPYRSSHKNVEIGYATPTTTVRNTEAGCCAPQAMYLSQIIDILHVPNSHVKKLLRILPKHIKKDLAMLKIDLLRGHPENMDLAMACRIFKDRKPKKDKKLNNAIDEMVDNYQVGNA
jgi:hypothetical protein